MAKVIKQQKITVQDLEKGVEFEVDEPREWEESSDESFDDEAYDTFKLDIVDGDGRKKPRFLGGPVVPFRTLKEGMTPITEDGLVLKEVLRTGVGVPIAEKSVVMMHYEAYIDERKEHFDSTRRRNRPFKFLLGDGNVLPGLEIGIQSMKKDEFARIIVSPQYAFGEMGCPPRIPPNSEILYEVEIINIHISKDVIEFEEMTPEDQKKAPFEKIVGVYHCENEMANNLFRQKKYAAAIARYKRVMNLFEDVSVDNEEEDLKRKGYLLKLYLNLAQCYINSQNPAKAIIFADLALKLEPENPKGLFRMGYALHMTDDYERASYFLNRAKKHKPYEKSINGAILKLEQKRKHHLNWERMFCKKMMGTDLNVDNKPMTLPESPDFINAIKDELKAFVDSDEKELVFSPGYTESQLEVVKVLAQEYNLAFVSKIQCDKKVNKVAKRKSST